MNYKQKGIAIVSLLATITMGTGAYANTGSVSTAPAVDAKMIAPEYNTNVTYNVNTTLLKNSMNKTSSLYELNCDSSKLFSSLGFSNVNRKIKNVTYAMNDTFDVTIDGVNCSIYGYSSDYNYKQEYFTEEEGINIAKSFIKSNFSELKVNTTNYIVLSKGNNRVYPVVAMAGSKESTAMDYTPEIITDDESDTYIDDKIYSMQILFPIKINNKNVYDQYGNMMGLTVDINNKRVSSINGSFLNIKLINRKAKLLDSEYMVKLIKNGGNSPYYNYSYDGKDLNIEFKDIEKVYVLFNTYDTKQKNYISTGLKLNSNQKVAYSDGKNYSQVISDYIIGNNQYYYTNY